MTTQQNNEWGDIPQGWEVVALGDLANLYQPETISSSQLQISGYPVYGANGIIGFYKNYNHKEPQVMVTCRGSTCGTVNMSVAYSWITGNAMIVSPNDRILKRFMYYLLSYQDLSTCITGSGQPQIVRTPLANFKVKIPKSLTEQSAIATVLSDTDKWIDSLTALIAKKQAIKSATMSQLLSGQKRLPQFAKHSDGTPKTYIQTDNGKIPEDWEVVALGDIGIFQAGNGFPISLQGKAVGQYPFFKVSDFNHSENLIYLNKSNNYIDEFERKLISAKIIPPNAIIFAKIGAAIFLERKKLTKNNSIIDNNIMAFIPATCVICNFIYFKFLQIKLGDLVEVTALPALSYSSLKDIKIAIPKSPTEQSAIAQILSDMDSDIIALEHRLTKARALKQGLMHQLLTGKIRLFSGCLNN